MVWGRGAIESKGVLCALLEAVEGLTKNGFVPSRDIYIAIVSNAESDNAGHKEIADIIRKRGIRFTAVFGKGNCISRDLLPVGRPQAVIGVAEKGRIKIRLYAEDKGGRTGTPPQYTVTGRMSEAICRTEYRSQPVRKSVVLMDLVAGLAPYLPFGKRILAANLWLFESAFFRSMRRYTAFSSMLRTTFAVTEIKAGSAENRLPSSAEATLQIRTIHGDSCSDICRFLMNLIDSTGVQAEVIQADEATQVSAYRGKAYAKLRRALAESFGEIIAVPGIIADNSSLNAYQQYTDGIYRITPFVLTEDEISTIHSTNERIGIEELGKAVIFYEKLIEKVAG
jgi:carboxypeptidase PM20D1